MNERQRRSLASSLRRVNKKPAAAEGEEGEGGGGKEGGTTTRISGGAAAILNAAVWLKMLPKSQLKSQSRSLLLPSLLLLLFGFAAFFLDSCSYYAGKLCCLSLTHTHADTNTTTTRGLPLIRPLLAVVVAVALLLFLFRCCFLFRSLARSFVRFLVVPLENKYKTNSPWEFSCCCCSVKA